MASPSKAPKLIWLLSSRRTLSRSLSISACIGYQRQFQRSRYTTMPSPPRIAIVGGGPAGLTMGLLLHKRNIPFTIFELREKPSEEELATPSGMLDLHEDSGLAVINECGLYDDFLPLTGECSEDFVIAKRDGSVLLKMGGEGSNRPEISRNNLAKLLSANIPSERIKWGHRLLSATRTAPSSHSETELDFGDHGKHTFDLVIGADGAWSKVRKMLTDTVPHFSNTHNITLTIRGITKKYPHLAKLVGSGSFMALGNKHAIISQRGPLDSSRIYLWLTVPDEKFGENTGLAGKPASSVKDKLLKDDALLGTFGDSLKELVVTACDEESADHPDETLNIRALYTLPHGSSWKHQPGVSLVGDAAHLMLPNGEGVNLAMLDSLLLSQAIIKATEITGNDNKSFEVIFDPLLKEFEAALLDRAKEVGIQTDALIGHMFGSNEAAHDLIDFFKSLEQQHPT